jgi:hypothetical protein
MGPADEPKDVGHDAHGPRVSKKQIMEWNVCFLRYLFAQITIQKLVRFRISLSEVGSSLVYVNDLGPWLPVVIYHFRKDQEWFAKIIRCMSTYVHGTNIQHDTICCHKIWTWS